MVTEAVEKPGNIGPSELQESNSILADKFNKKLLEAARAIIHEAGATPLMSVVDNILVLHGEMEKISNILAQDLRHSSYQLFQEELDRCHEDSVLVVGEELSNFLVKISELGDLNQFLIKITIQIFTVSFCVSQWQPYFIRGHAFFGESLRLITDSGFEINISF
jgi:hypothetical protein